MDTNNYFSMCETTAQREPDKLYRITPHLVVATSRVLRDRLCRQRLPCFRASPSFSKCMKPLEVISLFLRALPTKERKELLMRVGNCLYDRKKSSDPDKFCDSLQNEWMLEMVIDDFFEWYKRARRRYSGSHLILRLLMHKIPLTKKQVTFCLVHLNEPGRALLNQVLFGIVVRGFAQVRLLPDADPRKLYVAVNVGGDFEPI